MALEKLFECHDEGQLSVIKSLLEGNDIHFFVQNEHFGSLYPGPSMPFNSRIIMVPEEELERAQTLLSRLNEPQQWDEAG